MSSHPTITEEAANLLTETGDYRVLRRYQQPESYHQNDGSDLRIGLVVDTETTGLDDGAKIVELGAVAFEFCPGNGRIFRILNANSWFEDPGEPLTPEITALTGITDEMVAGQRIDDTAFEAMLASASVVIAHNAAFDRPKVERRFPTAAQKHWACTGTEIGWRAEGIGSAKLEFIAYRLGYFFDGHRASTDCLALLHAMAQVLPISGVPALAALLDRARQPTMRVWALQSPFDVKDTLKARGYSWSDGACDRPKSWYRDITTDEIDDELAFLDALPIPGTRPATVRLTARDRFSDRAWRIR